MIATGHTPNLLPGVSVVEKVRAADVFIVCDTFQYVRHSFCNRNRLAGGSWLTVPVADADTFEPMNRVRIADPSGRGREKIARTLEHTFGVDAARYAAELRKPYRTLVALNSALLRILLDDLGVVTPWVWQSHLEASWGAMDVSERLARMTVEVGADVWLSGPSGRSYLDEGPFEDRGIGVRYFQHDGANPSAVELLHGGLAVAA